MRSRSPRSWPAEVSPPPARHLLPLETARKRADSLRSWPVDRARTADTEARMKQVSTAALQMSFKSCGRTAVQ